MSDLKACDNPNCTNVYARGESDTWYLNAAATNAHYDLCSAKCVAILATTLTRMVEDFDV